MANIKLKVKSIPVTIDTEYIRLDALLKLAGAAATGGQAKFEIQSGEVELDGQTCLLRGKKVYAGQRIRHAGKTYEVVSNALPAMQMNQEKQNVDHIYTKYQARSSALSNGKGSAQPPLPPGREQTPSDANAPQAKTPFSKNIPGKQSGKPRTGREKT